MTTRYFVIDLETSVKNRGEFAIGKQSGSPHAPDNKIVLYGSLELVDYSAPSRLSIASDDTVARQDWVDEVLGKADYLIGQNIKFDCMYLLYHHHDEFMHFVKRGGQIYDTQLAEYILTGQEDKMIPLSSKYTLDKKGTKVMTREGLSVRYGGTDKDDRIAAFWNDGYETEDIPHTMLRDYLEDDLRNTAMIFIDQIDKLHAAGQYLLFASCCDQLLLTTIMEYNGMFFSLDQAFEDVVPLEKELTNLEEETRLFLFEHFSIFCDARFPLEPHHINPNSVQQLHTFIWGGSFNYTVDEPQFDDNGVPIIYKSGLKKGKQKTKKALKAVTVNSTLGNLADMPKTQNTSNGTITEIIDSTWITTKQAEFLRTVLKMRHLSKDINTYYLGLTSLTWPHDNCIHGSFIHTNTATGRLSSAAPNLQNITN